MRRLNFADLLGQAGAVVWMPVSPVAGQVFRVYGGESCEVEETNTTVPLLSTGFGPFDNVLKVIETLGGTDVDTLYFAPDIGCVKEEWNDGGESNGWDLKEILVEPKSDFHFDADVDGDDLGTFAQDYLRYDCNPLDPCEGDFDGDGDVDEADLAVFTAGMGWVGLP